MKKDKIYLILLDRKSNKSFKKYFDTEFSKDKFKRRMYYSKRLIVLKDSKNENYDQEKEGN